MYINVFQNKNSHLLIRFKICTTMTNIPENKKLIWNFHASIERIKTALSLNDRNK